MIQILILQLKLLVVLFLVNSLIQALVQLSSEVIVFHSAPANGQKQFLIPGLI